MLKRPQQPNACFDEVRTANSSHILLQNYRKRVHVGITNLQQNSIHDTYIRGVNRDADWSLGRSVLAKESRAFAYSQQLHWEGNEREECGMNKENVLITGAFSSHKRNLLCADEVLHKSCETQKMETPEIGKSGLKDLGEQHMSNELGYPQQRNAVVKLSYSTQNRQLSRPVGNIIDANSGKTRGFLACKDKPYWKEVNTQMTGELAQIHSGASKEFHARDKMNITGQLDESGNGIGSLTMIDRNRSMILASLQNIAKSPIVPTQTRIIKEQEKLLAIPHEESKVLDVTNHGCLQENLSKRTAKHFTYPKLSKVSDTNGSEVLSTNIHSRTLHFGGKRSSTIKLPVVVHDHIDFTQSSDMCPTQNTCDSNQYQTTNSEVYSPIYKANDARILYRTSVSTATSEFEKRKDKIDARYARSFQTLAQHDQARIQEEKAALIKAERRSRYQASLNYDYLNGCYTKEQKLDRRSQQMQKKHGGDSFLRMWAGSTESPFNGSKSSACAKD